MNKILGIAPLAILLAGSPLSAAEPTLALDSGNVQVGTGVICDTQEEVHRFVRLMDRHDAGAALQTVNRENENPLACGMATVAFSTGKDHGDVRNGKGTFKILEIEVIAGSANGNWQMIMPRRTQFTAIALPGLEI